MNLSFHVFRFKLESVSLSMKNDPEQVKNYKVCTVLRVGYSNIRLTFQLPISLTGTPPVKAICLYAASCL